MKDFMRYIAASCISFTFSTIFYLFFSFRSIFPPFTEQMVAKMLVISIAIIVLIYMVHLLPIENPFFLRLLELSSVLFVLVFAGRFFTIYPFTPYYTFFVVVIGILTYAVVIIVIFLGEQVSARRINSVIQKRKMEGFNE
ncbi:hypothetical protein JSQ81_02135 [Sporosarcina sp. Marseille-Q4063]|uniref:hypothetical protein n=1 Tax=Sporosarcina sp. Marseille-Q4063 TaxID=2810514 RepID=UPI001BAFB668|nr:hypothetical protein [Sporosarcina sp. Marseille-Q4063]QUW22409.1 hypothetical protein JSQ81_02135 [Sporosarcina sp. Marseille-Q4063]